MRRYLPLILAFSMTLPAAAANFTTSAEVKPILQATKASWVAVRLYEGRDLLYFTNLLAWRCGVSKIEYAVNGGEMTAFEPEPCYLDEAQPNAMKVQTLDTVLVPFDPNSVETVDVRLTFDDDTVEDASYTRANIQID